jgi:nuclear pore complex protein Nup62
MLATDLHTHLDDLSGSLSQMIDSVNALSLPSGPTDNSDPGGDDPMAQIAQILSSHLESLQWIDGAVREVEGRVGEVEKRVKESGHGNYNSSGIGLKPRSFGLNR